MPTRKRITSGKIESFKKADSDTNLIYGCLSAINLVFSYLLEMWRPIFIPSLVAFTIFVTLMKIKIIHEDDPGKGFRYRMILWFGLILLAVVPVISYFGLPFIESFLRNVFGPPLYERVPPEELRDIPSWHHGWSFFDILFFIPISIQFLIPYFLAKRIGNTLSASISKENEELGLELSEINKEALFFSTDKTWNLTLLLIIFVFLGSAGFIMKNFYSAILTGTMDTFYFNLIIFLLVSFPLYLVFISFAMMINLLNKPQPKRIRDGIKVMILLCVPIVYLIFFPNLFGFVYSLIS